MAIFNSYLYVYQRVFRNLFMAWAYFVRRPTGKSRQRRDFQYQSIPMTVTETMGFFTPEIGDLMGFNRWFNGGLVVV